VGCFGAWGAVVLLGSVDEGEDFEICLMVEIRGFL
jgi:hypothetical protein